VVRLHLHFRVPGETRLSPRLGVPGVIRLLPFQPFRVLGEFRPFLHPPFRVLGVAPPLLPFLGLWVTPLPPLMPEKM
jgi:hypothetical protein